MRHMEGVDLIPGNIELAGLEVSLVHMMSRETILRELLQEIREEYDYVFVDCPPVEIVADASIVNRYVDQTLFVIRAKVMDKSFLPEIEQWYQEKRYKNLSILLNGTGGEIGYHRYGYHKYGYGGRYGYGYGYGKAAYGKTAYGNEVSEN